MNYILAGKNNQDDAYFGLHGHIFHFTPFASYHPGLIGPVLHECGQDATEAFEALPHSRGARSITSLLAVIVDMSMLESVPSHDRMSCGLQVRHPPKNLYKLLRMSNSRPLGLTNIASKDPNSLIEKDLIPKRSHRRKARLRPTLCRIRQQYCSDTIHGATKVHAQTRRRPIRFSFFERSAEGKRRYYDPLRCEWKSFEVQTAQ